MSDYELHEWMQLMYNPQAGTTRTGGLPKALSKAVPSHPGLKIEGPQNKEVEKIQNCLVLLVLNYSLF